VRLVRLGGATSEVAADLKAALASWGVGEAVLGGVALFGYQPPGHPRPVDAVIVLPRGVLVAVGVDLPDPALKLSAPLTGQWRIDGWPLVSPQSSVNPASEAIAATAAVTGHLRPVHPDPVKLGMVIAIGPYVCEVTQPDDDIEQGARVLHPEPTTLLSAARELAEREQPFSVGQARRLLARLHPGGVIEGLEAEGFSSTEPVAVATPATPVTGGRKPRWLPIGAGALVVLLIGAGIVAAIAHPGGAKQVPQPQTATVDGTNYTRADSSDDGTACAQHSYGDVQVWLGQHHCSDLKRWSYTADLGGQSAGLSVAEVSFVTGEAAAQFQQLAAQPGAGGVSELVREGRTWQGGPASFDKAAFGASVAGSKVRLVEAVWIGKATTPGDDKLQALTKRTMGLPLID
jgi:hypothetical protein